MLELEIHGETQSSGKELGAIGKPQQSIHFWIWITLKLLIRSAKWDDVSESDKKRLRVTALDDGEFWMNFDDFQDQFQDVTVATIGPDFNQDGLSGKYSW